MLNCCSLIQTVLPMKPNRKVFMKNFKHKHLFHFSEYQSKFFDPTNKRVAGKIKAVFKGNPIGKLIGLKSKMHCILSENNKEPNTA